MMSYLLVLGSMDADPLVVCDVSKSRSPHKNEADPTYPVNTRDPLQPEPLS